MQHGVKQARFAMSATIGADGPQPLACLRVSRQKRTTNDRQQQQGDGDQREHPRISLWVFDLGLFQTEQVFRVAKAAFASPAALIFPLGFERGVVAVRDQMPDAPTPLPIARAALRDEQTARRFLAIAQSSETAPPRVAAHLERLKLPPPPLEEDLDVLFRANDESDFQALDQIKEQDIGEAAIGRHDQLRARQVAQDNFEQALDKSALDPAAMPFERPFGVRPPIDRHGAPPDNGRGDRQMLAILDRPVNRDSHKDEARQMGDEFGGAALGQGISSEPLIVQQARETLESGLLNRRGIMEAALRLGPGHPGQAPTDEWLTVHRYRDFAGGVSRAQRRGRGLGAIRCLRYGG